MATGVGASILYAGVPGTSAVHLRLDLVWWLSGRLNATLTGHAHGSLGWAHGGTLEGHSCRCRAVGCGPRLLAPASPCGSGWALGDRPLTRLACVFPRARLSCGPDGQPPNGANGPRGHRRTPELWHRPMCHDSMHNSQLRELNLFRFYKRLRIWCVESLISPPRHTQSGTHRIATR